ncbi:hypothetical protein CD932_20075 [Janthinobacterium sp. PC23-8]|nr:hypothetical protein CD932_20075 [Janthinobacterium sp. PC23-8]
MAISFDALRDHYPTDPKAELFERMGGQWPALVDDPLYANTCCVRLSIALKGAGVGIPAQYKEAIEGDGTAIVLKVKTMGELVTALLGKPYWGMSKNPGQPVGAGTIPARAGILVYHVAWNDATGHFDLWTGNDFVGNGNFGGIADGFSLAFWSLV